MNKAILSILGRDRPGIVAAVARVHFDQNCNIENVSQTMLQTEFAGIFIASLPEGMSVDDLHQELHARLTPIGLTVLTKPCEHGEDVGPTAACQPFVITTRGPDRKGLVAHISGVIARHGVNITTFIIIAFAIFLLVKAVNKAKKKEEAAPAAPPAPSKQEVLLGEIRDLLKARG